MKSLRPGAAQLERSIHLSGAVALVVGGVVGAGIFVLIASIAAEAGPAVWIAFLAAIGISLIGVIPLLHLAAAVPRAGAGYFFGSRFLSPYFGVLTSYLVILGGGSSTCVVAATLSVYVREYVAVPLPDPFLGMAIVLIFYVIYLFGLRLAMGLQVVMAAQFVVALLFYGFSGAVHSGIAVGLTSPGGAGGFLMAVLLCYSTCMGFQVIAEMGEEVHHARRTIPLALLIGGAFVAGLYILTGAVFVASAADTPGGYEALRAPLTESAAQFMPPWMVAFLGIGALTAGLTSLNAAAIALPRELFAQARDGLIPSALAWISPRTHAPQNAITVYFLFVLGMLAAGMDKEFYGYMAAIGILVMTSVLCFAGLRLYRLHPERAALAYIRFPMPLLILCTGLTVLVSIGFGLVMAIERPSVVVVYTVWTAAVSLGYFARTRRFNDADWRRLEHIPGDDEGV